MKIHWRHQWKVVACGHANYVPGGGELTLLLERCSCGKERERRLHGHWPIKLWDPSYKDDPELDQLRKMAGLK